MRWVVLVAAALVAAPVDAGVGRWEAWSPDGRHVAELDPARFETHVFRVSRDGTRHREWSMPGWFARASLADGGRHFVVAPDAGGIVPLNYRPDDVLLRFYDRGHVVREVTLSDIVPDPREMIRVESHYYWGRARGFDAENRYVVETVDRTVRFAASGGSIPGP